MLFTGFLVNSGLMSSTVKTYISAIKGILLESNIKLNADKFTLNSLTHACKLQNDRIITRLPIGKDLLQLIIKEIERKYVQARNIQPYLETLYKAIFMAAYYGLLRVGELGQGPHIVLARNVHIGVNKNKILFILNSSKTHDKSAKPQRIKIASTPISKSSQIKRFCPFKLLQNFISVRPAVVSVMEQFFVFADHSPVTPIHIRSTLKSALQALNLQADLYNIHSFHIGQSSDLFKLGVSVETIKKIGRWKSNAVMAYLHD